MYRFPCKHETGEVPYRSTDGSYINPPIASDYHPLTVTEIIHLMKEAEKIIRANPTSCGHEVSGIQVRLCQGITGITCPRSIDGEIAKLDLEISKIFVGFVDVIKFTRYINLTEVVSMTIAMLIATDYDFKKPVPKLRLK